MEDFQKNISKNWWEISITKSLESSRISGTDLTNLSQINVDLVSGQSLKLILRETQSTWICTNKYQPRVFPRPFRHWGGGGGEGGGTSAGGQSVNGGLIRGT